MLNSDGPNPFAVAVAVRGHVPMTRVDSTTCEIWALIEALQRHVGTARIYCDNDHVVEGPVLGRAACVAGSNPYCELWKRVWELLGDIGSNGCDDLVSIFPVKGHATQADLDSGAITAQAKAGNTWADQLAKASSAASSPAPQLAARFADACADQKTVCSWIGEASAVILRHLGSDAEKSPPLAERRRARAARLKRLASRRAAAGRAPAAADSKMRHVLLQEEGASRCL